MAKKIAMLFTNGVEQVELTSPKEALEQAGMKVDMVSPETGTVKAWNHTDWGESFQVNISLDQANADDYDGLVLPGGVMNPDNMRTNEKARAFVRSFFEAGKPVGAICHAPWMLIDAGVVEGRELTSYHTLQTDLKNAGANWVDREVVVDEGLVTSRNPDDLPAFNAKLIEEFREGIHEGQHS
jgi:protease I